MPAEDISAAELKAPMASRWVQSLVNASYTDAYATIASPARPTQPSSLVFEAEASEKVTADMHSPVDAYPSASSELTPKEETLSGWVDDEQASLLRSKVEAPVPKGITVPDIPPTLNEEQQI
ncbi:hypothetical protein KIPB_012157, partial [Kipferlia bialata]|eukprot:g12157.t1